MNWISTLNKALEYIESNLENEVEIKKIAQICLCSEYNIQRVFSVLSGVTLGEYTRNRRLSKAAVDIRETDMRIIDIACKYGYESADAFSKAFKNFHGISPKEGRIRNNKLKTYPKLHFSMIIKGGKEMKNRITEKEEFRVIGVKRSYKNVEEGTKDIPKFWEEFNASSKCSELCSKMDGDIKGILGLCRPHETGAGYDYYICVNSNAEISGKYEEFVVPKATWMVFEAKGKLPESVQSVTTRIYEEILTGSEYKHDNKPDFEVYLSEDITDENYVTEIWVPVVKS
jgi:AraC family transcriptional regulator